MSKLSQAFMLAFVRVCSMKEDRWWHTTERNPIPNNTRRLLFRNYLSLFRVALRSLAVGFIRLRLRRVHLPEFIEDGFCLSDVVVIP
jgi:hypothetical protein